MWDFRETRGDNAHLLVDCRGHQQGAVALFEHAVPHQMDRQVRFRAGADKEPVARRAEGGHVAGAGWGMHRRASYTRTELLRKTPGKGWSPTNLIPDTIFFWTMPFPMLLVSEV